MPIVAWYVLSNVSYMKLWQTNERVCPHAQPTGRAAVRQRVCIQRGTALTG
jgi:hypothetical protein